MRRLITVFMCAALLAPLTFGVAQARAVDPVAALAKQLKSAHGVHFTSVSSTSPGFGIKTRSYGDLQFGRSQVQASNVIATVDYGTLTKANEQIAEILGLDPDVFSGPTQTITIKDIAYVSGGLTDLVLPEGKIWYKSKTALTRAGLNESAISVFSPSELKKLLAQTTSKKAGGTVDGVATTLYAGSSVIRLNLDGIRLSLKTNWKLWIGVKDGLIRRIASNDNLMATLKKSKPIRAQITSDTYLTGWGQKVWIYAPDPRLVYDFKESLPAQPSVLGAIDLGD